MHPRPQTIEFRPPSRLGSSSAPEPSLPLSPSWNDLLAEVLESQHSMTVVERFSQIHDQHLGTQQARYFRDLIPLSQPGPGQQYGFEVDLDRCSSCKACVTACHSLNGLRPGETWRNVGLLSSNNPSLPLQKTVTTACHHCVEPGCLQGCPVLAYDKDPITGIVRHLDDQCIGCQYCILKCPYDVPKYSAALGIVRKCDLCSNRLAVGEAPACVRACPNEAIRVVLVDQKELRERFQASRQSSSPFTNPFLPDSPSPDYTLPTTRYVSRDLGTPSLRAADAEQAVPSDPHTPLVLMLTLSQAATGLLTAAAILQIMTGPSSSGGLLCPAALGLLLASMAVGTTHLGQPLKAWRSFLGWRQSWLSRELLAFGAMLPVTVLAALGSFLPLPSVAGQVIIPLAALLGWAGVTCSAMLYADTRRPFWSARRTFSQFYLSTLLLGASWGLALAGQTHAAPVWAGTVVLIALIKSLGWLRFARHASGPASEPDTKSARLLWTSLIRWNALQHACLVLGGVVVPVLMASGAWRNEMAAWTSLGLVMIGDGAEKSLFFRAVVPMKMPGGIPA